jgi:integral membrane protein
VNSPAVTRLRWIGYAEGASYLLLLLVAMPLKYVAGKHEAVQIVGSAHGGLWVLYMAALAWVWRAERWPFLVAFWGGVASVLPFGPFVYDRWLAKRP